jgi:hypothetical protein
MVRYMDELATLNNKVVITLMNTAMIFTNFSKAKHGKPFNEINEAE